MIKEAIILAGGLGTRLRPVVKNYPKSMSNIAGKPFLCYILDYLVDNNIKKVILAVGHKYEIIKDYFGKKYKNIDLQYSIEAEPLGTGGAAKLALKKLSNSELVFLLNGDTYFPVNLKKLYEFHLQKNAEITIALKKMYNFDRYGIVEINDSNRIVNFFEKIKQTSGLINGGIYLINPQIFKHIKDSCKVSFEKDILEKQKSDVFMFGKFFNNYFLDIGIPQDLKTANIELPNI